MQQLDRQPVLCAPSLVLRPLRADDWHGLYAVASDPAIWAQHPAHDRWQEPVFRTLFEQSLASGGAVVGEHNLRSRRAAPGSPVNGSTIIE